ncbi:MAG TPA: hypothetical protein VFV99_00420 [Kofleriaceae bacterium]|nr:hypothetical protein [Kofleriaceae bacterium]
MKGWMFVVIAVGGCVDEDASRLGTQEQGLTEGQVNALNNVGRTTGVTYQLIDNPDLVAPFLVDNPDLIDNPDILPPLLQLQFRPVSDLLRISEYLDGSGQLLGRVASGDPHMSCQGFTSTTIATMKGGAGSWNVSLRDRAGTSLARLAPGEQAPPDPDRPGEQTPPDPERPGDVTPPDPDRVTISIRLTGAATVNIYDANGNLIQAVHGGVIRTGP